MNTVLVMMVVGFCFLYLAPEARAIPIAATVTLATPQPTIIGYQRVTTGKHWTWGGRKRKWVTIPIYATAAPIPEPQTYAMLAAGLGLVAYRVNRCKRT